MSAETPEVGEVWECFGYRVLSGRVERFFATVKSQEPGGFMVIERGTQASFFVGRARLKRRVK